MSVITPEYTFKTGKVVANPRLSEGKKKYHSSKKESYTLSSVNKLSTSISDAAWETHELASGNILVYSKS